MWEAWKVKLNTKVVQFGKKIDTSERNHFEVLAKSI